MRPWRKLPPSRTLVIWGPQKSTKDSKRGFIWISCKDDVTSYIQQCSVFHWHAWVIVLETENCDLKWKYSWQNDCRGLCSMRSIDFGLRMESPIGRMNILEWVRFKQCFKIMVCEWQRCVCLYQAQISSQTRFVCDQRQWVFTKLRFIALH